MHTRVVNMDILINTKETANITKKMDTSAHRDLFRYFHTVFTVWFSYTKSLLSVFIPNPVFPVASSRGRPHFKLMLNTAFIWLHHTVPYVPQLRGKWSNTEDFTCSPPNNAVVCTMWWIRPSSSSEDCTFFFLFRHHAQGKVLLKGSSDWFYE